ncbi:hypothetical protein [Lacrimispora sp.]|uniref:hypothetical protein n=1 Tax=Lacrimispora sp. TaxID=2719234 RepID=UPI002856A930|nr:hypothetical protein [Lacrimispora sp.]MDR7812718.1 hypothetical protein [Lacrimispora sp.]
MRGDDATENKLDKINLRLNIGLEGNPVINNFTINLGSFCVKKILSVGKNNNENSGGFICELKWS